MNIKKTLKAVLFNDFKKYFFEKLKKNIFVFCIFLLTRIIILLLSIINFFLKISKLR